MRSDFVTSLGGEAACHQRVVGRRRRAGQDIEITHADARTTAKAPSRAYAGDTTYVSLFALGERSPMMAVNVSFEPGSRTVWHNHPAGQYLIVTSGVGWVQQRGGPKREIREGDGVWTPPGVFHWHGATTDSAMSHLAVWQLVDGSGGEVGEHVSDEVYLSDTRYSQAACRAIAPALAPVADRPPACAPRETRAGPARDRCP